MVLTLLECLSFSIPLLMFLGGGDEATKGSLMWECCAVESNHIRCRPSHRLVMAGCHKRGPKHTVQFKGLANGG